MNNLALLLSKKPGGAAGAEALYRESLGMQRKVLGASHPDTLRSLSDLSVQLKKTGQTVEAEALYQETLEQQRKVLGESHPDVQRTRWRFTRTQSGTATKASNILV
jgi:hypothetical protein